MVSTVKQACRFNPVYKDYSMSQGIENLADLIRGEGDGRQFFARNFVTCGMEQLFREGLLRLSGKSDRAVFELTQAMGGGKTHLMIALGLLARDPQLRKEVLAAELSTRIDFGSAQIATFSGRNNPQHYLWGELANQLGQAEAIKPFWVNGPRAVDQPTWKQLIGDQPTLILFDELPPYLDNASTQVLGQGTLATVVVYSLSNLLSAALELPHCAIVIANLSGSYHKQTEELKSAISNLQQETRRQAVTITPVQLAGNEIYQILKKRLIEQLPPENVIAAVAQEYAQQIKKLEDRGDINAASLEQIATQVRETYPFHPSFKHLVALFKENEGFSQTRGLMRFTARLLKSVAEREADDVYLVGTQHLALNDSQVRDEIDSIAPKLGPAVTRDVADKGNATAEMIDKEFSGDAARQVMTLLLASSLSRAVGGRIGLSAYEIIEFLAAPQCEVKKISQALAKLRERAWYLHREEQRFFLKETQNLSRQIEHDAKEIPQAKVDKALIEELGKFLQPRSRLAYQEVQVLPPIAQLRLNGPRTLIVLKPDGKVLPGEMQLFFECLPEKNNLLVLTGQDSHLAADTEVRLRERMAIEQLCTRLKDGDTLFAEAGERLEEAKKRFEQALSAAYNRLYFPRIEPLDESAYLAGIALSTGLALNKAEAQLEDLLASAGADCKLVRDLPSQWTYYFAMAEQYLWPEGGRRSPWADIVSRAKSNPAWPWLPLDTLKVEALKQHCWRLGADNYLEKGPFPPEQTSVNVTLSEVCPQTGESILSLSPCHAGDSPVVVYASRRQDLPQGGQVVPDLGRFTTKEATLYFQALDPSGRFETGKAVPWIAALKIRREVEPAADSRRIRLECTPRAELFYTLDGCNPKEGTAYQGPFEIGPQAVTLLVYARAGEAACTEHFKISSLGDKVVQVDDTKPGKLQRKRMALDSTEKVYHAINKFRDQPGIKLKGARLEIGSGDVAVTVRFGAREVTFAAIEGIVSSLRSHMNAENEVVILNIAESIQFDNGFSLKDFARLAGIQLEHGDVVQETL